MIFSMEKFIESLPRPVLAVLAILVGIVVIMLINPPHTVCDTQEAAFRESQKGNLFQTEVNKKKIPGSLVRAKEACQLGNSAGSCYEYFTSLRSVSNSIGKGSAECMTQLFDIKDVSAVMNDGVELMARLAWGTKPPEPGLERFGWMQEAELAIFCRLKNTYVRAKGDEAWTELRKKVFAKLPGEESVVSSDPSVAAATPKSATIVLQEQDIWNRSIFSVRCENY
jgi:hypothetical protein